MIIDGRLTDDTHIDRYSSAGTLSLGDALGITVMWVSVVGCICFSYRFYKFI